jgi:hypothetical protein
MSEPFFIETSQGIINRSMIRQISTRDYKSTPGIWIAMGDDSDIYDTEIYLEGEEARLFLAAIPVSLSTGSCDLEKIRCFSATAIA